MKQNLCIGAGITTLVVLLASTAPVAAQFVCVGNATGAAVPPGTADGAGGNAAGSGNNVACGPNANASGGTGRNTALGTQANASGDGSENVALGDNANASGSGSSGGGGTSNTAVGNSAVANGDRSRNIASGSNSRAVGNDSRNTASGFTSNADGNGSANTASGAGARAFGNGSSNTAIGDNAFAAGDGGARTAIGGNARAEGANSSAFGAGAVATRANQMAFGTKDSTYTMSGIASAASKAAQGAPTHIVTSNASGDLAAHTFAELGLPSPGDIANLQSQINGLGQRDKELADGIAISLALAQPFFQAGQTFAMNVGWGTRAILGQEVVDVGSTDRGRLASWFAGKVGYAVTVPDLPQQCFSLQGGRIDYLQDRPVATLALDHEARAISLYMMPSNAAEAVAVRGNRNGYSVVGWLDAGFAYFAASDLDRKVLDTLQDAVIAANGQPAMATPAPSRGLRRVRCFAMRPFSTRRAASRAKSSWRLRSPSRRSGLLWL